MDYAFETIFQNQPYLFLILAWFASVEHAAFILSIAKVDDLHMVIILIAWIVFLYEF